MQDFLPQQILIETAMEATPVARRILAAFPRVARRSISNLQEWKEPGPMTPAKRILAIAEYKGEALKPFPKIKHAINLGDYVFNPVSNCHLECTYCILQSYLKNNPILTVFANTEHFLSGIAALAAQHAGKTLRIGTGELSDSLALDDLTRFSSEWVPFFSRQKNIFLELKTKSDRIRHLLPLEHRGRTVISWSLAPERIVQQEELKCAPLSLRLDCARRVQEAGYPVGLHFDPMIYHDDWRSSYADLLQDIAKALDPSRVAWVSIGSLRFDKALKEIAGGRFRQTKIFAEDFVAAPDGKFRYFKTLRREMYRAMWAGIRAWDKRIPKYFCMEPPWMWEAATDEPAPRPEAVEASLIERLRELAA